MLRCRTRVPLRQVLMTIRVSDTLAMSSSSHPVCDLGDSTSERLLSAEA